MAACCSAAFLNGFPLVFSDTAAHLAAGLNFAVPWDRPIFYGLFIRPFLFADLWPVVIVQSGVIAYALWVAARIVRADLRPSQFAAIVVALCLFSSLPWVAGQVIPDIFTAIVILGIFAIFFGGAELTSRERCGAWVLTAFAISTHLSHLPLAALLMAISALCRIALFGLPGLLRRVGLASGALAVAIAAILASNLIQSGKPTLSQGSGIFALAKLLESGTAHAYLAQACPRADFALCGIVGELPRDVNAFLWSDDSPTQKLGGPHALLDESRIVARNTILSFPLPVLEHAAKSAFRQLLSFSVASGRDSRSVSVMFEDVDFGARFRSAAFQSRQGRNALPFAEADLLGGIGLLASLAAMALRLATGARRNTLALSIVALAGVLGNAAICGALSVVDARYQSRVVWPVTFVGLLAAFELWKGRGAGKGAHQGVRRPS